MFSKSRQLMLEVRSLFSMQVMLLSFITIFLILLTGGLFFFCMRWMKRRHLKACCSESKKTNTETDNSTEYNEDFS